MLVARDLARSPEFKLVFAIGRAHGAGARCSGWRILGQHYDTPIATPMSNHDHSLKASSLRVLDTDVSRRLRELDVLRPARELPLGVSRG